MDFSYLLEIAEMNKKKQNEENKSLLPSKLPNPKKASRPGPKGEAIKAFLEKQENEKREKDEQKRKQREELLYKRSLDKHSTKRMNTMIKRTKGASKAVLDDAKDLITVNGEEDEYGKDDYGYESTHSQNIFNKLVNQYKDGPKDDRLNVDKTAKKNLSNIKDRVRDSLRKEDEEALGIRKRQRKRKKHDTSDDFINDGDSYKKFPSSKGFKEPEPPKKPGEEPPKKQRRVNKGPPPMSFQDLMKVAQKKASAPPPSITPKDIMETSKPPEPIPRPMTAKEKKEAEEERLRKLRIAGKLSKEEPKPSEKNSTKSEESSKKVAKPVKSVNTPEPKVFNKAKYFAVPSSSKAKQSGSTPAPSKPKVSSTARPHPAEKPKVSAKPKHKPPSRPSRIDDDSEYDSEMDDFIDDGDQELDYSSEISKIFGYNKAKYRDVDEEDDSSMVASFGDMEREEKISTKIGIMEDLEDMKREEMEKKAKLKRKKLAGKH